MNILPLFWNMRNNRGGSCIWKKISSHLYFLQKDSKWISGNDRSISLWFDNWIDSKPIAPRLPFLHFSEKDSVADIIVDRAWCIPSHLPIELKELLSLSTSLISIESNNAPDTLTWPGSSSGVFSISTAWNSLRTAELPLLGPSSSRTIIST